MGSANTSDSDSESESDAGWESETDGRSTSSDERSDEGMPTLIAIDDNGDDFPSSDDGYTPSDTLVCFPEGETPITVLIDEGNFPGNDNGDRRADTVDRAESQRVQLRRRATSEWSTYRPGLQDRRAYRRRRSVGHRLR